MFKFAVLFTTIAVCQAGILPLSYSSVTLHPYQYVKVIQPEWKVVDEWKAPEYKADEWKAPVEWKEPETPANYDFKYEVHDEKTGDLKRQEETAVNGAVKGQYSLIDSDGFKRIVEYTADDHHGFQATVKREPTHYKIPEPVKYVEVIPHEKWW